MNQETTNQERVTTFTVIQNDKLQKSKRRIFQPNPNVKPLRPNPRTSANPGVERRTFTNDQNS